MTKIKKWGGATEGKDSNREQCSESQVVRGDSLKIRKTERLIGCTVT